MGKQAETGPLPEFVIIGAMKCGTTSLHYYLDAHPEISMSATKELNFFSDDENWRRGEPWYRAQFPAPGRLRGEASPIYTDYPFTPHVPERMSLLLPRARLIYLMRDPLERIVSHYVHACSSGEETRPLPEALAGDDHVYLARSRYATQLRRYLRYYAPEQVLVLRQEALLEQRRETLQQVFAFLGVDPEFHSPKFESVRHKSRDKRQKTRLGQALDRLPLATLIRKLPTGIQWHVERLLYLPFSQGIARPALDADTRARLHDLLAPEMEDLRRLTGQSFPGWSL